MAVPALRSELRPTIPTDVAEGLIAGAVSPHTRRAYSIDVAHFLHWLGERGLPLSAVTKETVRQYRRALAEHYSAATVNRRLSTVRQLLDTAVDRGVLRSNPAKTIHGVRIADTSPTQGLTAQEARALVDACDVATLRGRRDHALLSLMLRCGLRRAEISALEVSQLQRRGEHRVLQLVGKGKKPATVKLPPDVAAEVDDWLVARERREASALFLPVYRCMDGETESQRCGEEPLSQATVWQIVTARAHQAGIAGKITPHSLRHTFVTLALDGGAPLQRVQAAARHADPRTTMRYWRTGDNLDDNAVDYVSF